MSDAASIVRYLLRGSPRDYKRPPSATGYKLTPSKNSQFGMFDIDDPNGSVIGQVNSSPFGNPFNKSIMINDMGLRGVPHFSAGANEIGPKAVRDLSRQLQDYYRQSNPLYSWDNIAGMRVTGARQKPDYAWTVRDPHDRSTETAAKWSAGLGAAGTGGLIGKAIYDAYNPEQIER